MPIDKHIISDLFGPTAGAVFDGPYRYDLFRVWDLSLPSILFVMLNPSTANSVKLDPTVTRCRNYAIKWQYGTLYVVNLFAYKATNPKELKGALSPVGPENDKWIRKRAKEADKIIVAWGANSMVNWNSRSSKVLAILRKCKDVYCLGMSNGGHPVHPLYQPSGVEPELYEGR